MKKCLALVDKKKIYIYIYIFKNKVEQQFIQKNLKFE